MIRRGFYILLGLTMISCASKTMQSSIQSLQAENKSLRGDVARLQEHVLSLTNDMLVVQSRVENRISPMAPMAVIETPAPVVEVEAPKKMFRTESFLGDDMHFTDDEPMIKSAIPTNTASTKGPAKGSSKGTTKFTNKDLPEPLVPEVSTERNKTTAFSETTLVPDTSKSLNTSAAKPNIEDPIVVNSYNRAYKSFTDQNYKNTIVLMNEFLQQNPQHQYSDNAHFWIGESYYQLKNFDQANKEFETVVSQYPNGNKVPDALLRSGICLLKLSKPEQAKSSFNQLIRKYPKSVAAHRAKATLGEL